MINNSVWLVAFPDTECRIKRIDLKILMQRALRIESRMVKGVNLDDEHRRYNTICDRLEFYGQWLAISGKAEVYELGVEYLPLLYHLIRQNPEAVRQARLTSDFCPAENIAWQLEQFINLSKSFELGGVDAIRDKIDFYRTALENGYNVIEVQQFTANGELISLDEGDEELRRNFLSLRISDSVTHEDSASNYRGLVKQIHSVISDLEQGIPAAVNFSDMGHYAITQVLHKFVYQQKKRLMLPIIYGDGSKAAPFPIGCLYPRRKGDVDFSFKNVPLINIGMMSERHPELDPLVKAYVFRNQELSTGKTAGEIDNQAYEQAKRFFDKTRSEGKYNLAYYQTGFQPVLVGFYRALTEELMFRSHALPTLQVTPVYFFGEYEYGQAWN